MRAKPMPSPTVSSGRAGTTPFQVRPALTKKLTRFRSPLTLVKRANTPMPWSFALLWSNRHRSFDSARENKAVRPQDHLKRAATANLLVSYENCGVWWRLLHNSGEFLDVTDDGLDDVAPVEQGLVEERHR